MHLYKRFSLQTGLAFSSKTRKEHYYYPFYEAWFTDHLGYLELPLIFKYGIPVGQHRFTVGIGGYIAYGIAGKSKLETYPSDPDEGTQNIKWGKNYPSHYKPLDAGVSAQVGYEVVRRCWVKFQYSKGITNIFPYSNYAKTRNSANLLLTVGYRIY